MRPSSALADSARRGIAAVVGGLEDVLAAGALLLMALLPVVEFVLRSAFDRGIPGSTAYVANLTLWVGFSGAIVAARESRHLVLTAGLEHLLAGAKHHADPAVHFIVGLVTGGLFLSSTAFVLAEIGSPIYIDDWLPEWIAELVMPAGFAVIAVHLAMGGSGWGRAAALLGTSTAIILWFAPVAMDADLVLPAVLVLLIAAILGAPIFVVIGGIALILFVKDGISIAAVSVEAYRMVGSPVLATLPLFTLAGYLLAQGGTVARLVRLFDAWLGWMPGGFAIAATLVCAFFSTFTGASGITILALGGMLLPVLVKGGYPERSSIGLLTATGSIGLLFPPSLAVILYGVVAHVPIPDLFAAGLIPGLAMVAIVCLFGARVAIRSGVVRRSFDLREGLRALWIAKWEVLLPIVTLTAMFGGYCSLTEAAAITAVYVLVVQALIYRDLSLTRDLPGILVKCGTLMGGVLTILCVAMGLTNYLVDAEIPGRVAALVSAWTDSQLVFLLALNLFLLVIGCLMDIFSATAVVLPIIIPISSEFGVSPLHLAMIFLTNLELGYLTPPVGMNLFLASYRFDRSLAHICRASLPFLLLLFGIVLIVTYLPLLVPELLTWWQ
jgi:tripartite ATP-independent transporter DctM subunit